MVFADVQIGISIHGYQFYYFCIIVNAGNNNRIRVRIIHIAIS